VCRQLPADALLARSEDLVEAPGEQCRPAQVDVGAVVSLELDASAQCEVHRQGPDAGRVGRGVAEPLGHRAI
jgi:hypothetical protein